MFVQPKGNTDQEGKGCVKREVPSGFEKLPVFWLLKQSKGGRRKIYWEGGRESGRREGRGREGGWRGAIYSGSTSLVKAERDILLGTVII